MSYYTLTRFSFDASDRPKCELSHAEVLAVAGACLDAIDWPGNALQDLEEGLNDPAPQRRSPRTAWSVRRRVFV